MNYCDTLHLHTQDVCYLYQDRFKGMTSSYHFIMGRHGSLQPSLATNIETFTKINVLNRAPLFPVFTKYQAVVSISWATGTLATFILHCYLPPTAPERIYQDSRESNELTSVYYTSLAVLVKAMPASLIQ